MFVFSQKKNFKKTKIKQLKKKTRLNYLKYMFFPILT